jgi:hypothetical protein
LHGEEVLHREEGLFQFGNAMDPTLIDDDDEEEEYANGSNDQN